MSIRIFLYQHFENRTKTKLLGFSQRSPSNIYGLRKFPNYPTGVGIEIETCSILWSILTNFEQKPSSWDFLKDPPPNKKYQKRSFKGRK